MRCQEIWDGFEKFQGVKLSPEGISFTDAQGIVWYDMLPVGIRVKVGTIPIIHMQDMVKMRPTAEHIVL